MKPKNKEDLIEFIKDHAEKIPANILEHARIPSELVDFIETVQNDGFTQAIIDLIMYHYGLAHFASALLKNLKDDEWEWYS
ncbi:MAG: hypothetical protein ACXQS8_08765 [Candidatus Helarchaeales archaeon]